MKEAIFKVLIKCFGDFNAVMKAEWEVECTGIFE